LRKIGGAQRGLADTVGSTTQPNPKPNHLFMMADQVRADWLDSWLRRFNIYNRQKDSFHRANLAAQRDAASDRELELIAASDNARMPLPWPSDVTNAALAFV
jgi:hypothetical protein